MAKAKPKKTTAAKKGSQSTKKSTTANAKKQTKLDSVTVQWMIEKISEMIADFTADHDSDSALTGTERRRLIGAGVRNYGFIEKAWDIARENPQFLPGNFSAAQFHANIQSLDEYRQLLWMLEKFVQVVNEAMLISADASMRDALRIYRTLREQTMSRVHGAEPLFRALLRFFQRPRHPEQESTEPTLKQLEQDFNKLVHGKAEGEIIVKNEKPRATGGKREIVDEVRTGRAVIKGSVNEDIQE